MSSIKESTDRITDSCERVKKRTRELTEELEAVDCIEFEDEDSLVRTIDSLKNHVKPVEHPIKQG